MKSILFNNAPITCQVCYRESSVWWKGCPRWQYISSAKCVLMISLSKWEHLTETYCWLENKLVSIGQRWSLREWTFNIVTFILTFPLKGSPTSLSLSWCHWCGSYLHFGGKGWWRTLSPPPQLLPIVKEEKILTATSGSYLVQIFVILATKWVFPEHFPLCLTQAAYGTLNFRGIEKWAVELSWPGGQEPWIQAFVL